MVFYFTLSSDPSVTCYMGKDKYENEALIKHGWPEDIWFHVDSHSSAHVYVRMPRGKSIDDLSPEMIEECCQLTKQNSIEGCKLNDVKVVYTPWTNLHKTGDMVAGQVGFHDNKLKRYHTVAKKDTALLRRLDKTRVEKNDVDLAAQRAQRDAAERQDERAARAARAAAEKAQREEAERQAALRCYADVLTPAQLRSNVGNVPDEDDFIHAVVASRALTTPLRALRVRNGGSIGCRDRSASSQLQQEQQHDDDDEHTARPPPAAMPLAYLLAHAPLPPPLPHFVDARTEATVWQVEHDVATAWRALYAAMARAYDEGDAPRAAVLRARDAVALAHYTAHAETRHLLAQLPPSLRAALVAQPRFAVDTLEELYLHLGHEVEARGSGGGGASSSSSSWLLRLPPPTPEELRHVRRRLGRVGDDGRACVAQTAHRASVWRGRGGDVLGVTLRVGRYVPNAARALLPLAQRGSMLVVSPAGMGKTTLLRDLAVSLAHTPLPPHRRDGDGDDNNDHDKQSMRASASAPPPPPRVTIVDTSNEVGGDGAVPLPFLGRCRRMQVPTRAQQGAVMAEVVQNHTPEYVIVDELVSADEAQAAWSVTQRGVRVLATCHGASLRGLLQNPSLNLLVGGVAQAFLSNEERRLRNKTRKTVLERPQSSPFDVVVELRSRTRAFVYVDVNAAVDALLDDRDATREADVGALVDLTRPLPSSLVRLLTTRARSSDKDTTHKSDDGGSEDDGESGGQSDDGRGVVHTRRRRHRRDDDDLLDELCG